MHFYVNYTHKKVEVEVQTGLFKGDFFSKTRTFLLTDSNLYNHYHHELNKFEDLYIVPAGEKSKNIATVEEVLEKLLKLNYTKSDYLVALGGGMITDLGAFISSLYKRGMNLILIPTSLLAMVDSCLGGKTGVNFQIEGNYYKNQIGTIYHPNKVLIDSDFLKTLSRNEYRNGFGEVIKYGLCFDRELFDLLFDDFEIDDVIIRCIKIKAQITETDEFENAERLLLNFGHTIGHAIESLSNFQISHGQAIAIGMLYEVEDEEIRQKLLELYRKYNFDYQSFKAEELESFIIQDKKIKGKDIYFPILEEIGKVKLKKMNIEDYLRRIK